MVQCVYWKLKSLPTPGVRESKLQTIISLEEGDVHGLTLVGVRSAVKYEKAVQVIPIYIYYLSRRL